MPSTTSARLARAALVVSCLAALAPGRAAALLAPGDTDRPIEAGGLARHYLLHVPTSYDGLHPVPLVLDFHGFTSNAVQQKGLSGWVPLSDAKGFLLVHPDGVDAAWNAGICCGNADIDDVGFVRAVVADVVAQASVDVRRIYATGLSNGGAMSQRLACDAADLFAASAPMAFPVPFAPLSTCRPSRAIPVFTAMGLTDALVAYGGGPFASAADTFDYWHDVDGCRGTTPDVTQTSGSSKCETYTRCTNALAVCLCSVTARSFPGAPFSGHVLYLNDDLNLAQVAWDFMSQFELPETARPPVHALLRGENALSVGRAGANAAPVAWEVTLNQGTWWASDGDTVQLSGPTRSAGTRRWTLGLTTAGEQTLLAWASQRAAVVAGQDVGTLAMRGPQQLQASVGGRSKQVKLVGRLRFGSTSGTRLTLRVRLGGQAGAGA